MKKTIIVIIILIITGIGIYYFVYNNSLKVFKKISVNITQLPLPTPPPILIAPLGIGGIQLSVPTTWKINKISNNSAIVTIEDLAKSFTLEVKPCNPNDAMYCFGSGAGNGKKIPGGTMVYPVSTGTMASFGLGLTTSSDIKYFYVSADFGDNNLINDSEYKMIDTVIATAKL
jgi:hypothetical protein